MAITGIYWHVGATYTQPHWSVDPDVSVIEAISCHHLFQGDSASGEPTVTFLAEGAFNKIYTVETKEK